MHYTDRGEGMPVVFLHGIFESRLTFLPIANRLARKAGCRCVTMELRGHGLSVADGGRFTLSQYAEDVESMLDEIAAGPDGCVLCGYSLGAYMIMNYIRHYGTGRLRALALLDWSPKALTEGDWKLGIMSGSYGPDEMRRDLALIETDYPRFLAHLVYHNVRILQTGRKADERPPWWAWAAVPFIPVGRRKNREHIFRLWKFLAEADYRELLAGIDLPTLLICAVPGSLFLPEAADYMKARMGAHARLVRIGGAGPARVSHHSLPRRRRAIASALTDFIESL
jgi:pimeloyl-ACP methyl ester carboxylesterase